LIRGDLTTVAVAGDHGKPRPAVVVQADALARSGTFLVCLLSSDVEKSAPYRLLLHPTPGNGLLKSSLVQADKIYPIPVAKCGKVIGQLAEAEIAELNTHLTFVLGLGD
jgi:mRNA interferase MazF